MVDQTLLMMAIIYSCEISLLSIGFTLTYLTAKIPNFAHGTYAGIGIYVSYTISKIFNYSPYFGFPIAFILGGLIGVVLYITIINVINRMGGGEVVKTIATIAIQIFVSAALFIYAYWLRGVYSTYAFGFLLKSYDFYIGVIPGVFFVSIFISIFTVILLHLYLTRMKSGIAMRATAENPELASIVGVNTYNSQLLSWFLTGGLACVAGAMLPLWFQSNPDTGGAIMVSIMAASLLGGIQNIYGALIGGFGVGLSEILFTNWLQNQTIGTENLIWIGEYRPIIPLIILILVILIEPRGIQGFIENLNKLRKDRRFTRG
jgi:branched-chain amino acid transport system permease protein